MRQSGNIKTENEDLEKPAINYFKNMLMYCLHREWNDQGTFFEMKRSISL